MKQTSLSIISWNVNGIRAVIKKQCFLEFIEKYKPDILCLQETKAERDQVEIDLPEYEEFWNSSTSKKGYSGTAIFTKVKPISIHFGINAQTNRQNDLRDEQERDAALEGRVVTAEFEKFFVVTVYTPNAKDDLSRLQFRYKKWDPLFLEHVKNLEKKKPVIFCGDLNVAHEEIDLARPKENIGNKGFTDEEREGFANFVEAGFIDSFRAAHPHEPGHYTWWTQWGKARERNVGWRIDYVMVSQNLQKKVTNALILPEVLGSDHCPVGITLQIK